MKNTRNFAWLCLVISGLTEIIWAYTMKLSHGFTVLWPSIITILVLIVGFFLLERAVRELGIGVSYSVFTGIGIVGTSLIGMLALHEGVSALKILSVVVLCVGIIGLKLCDGEDEAK